MAYSMYEKVPRVFVPIIWFEQRASMTPEMATSLLALLALPSGGNILGLAMLAIGIVLALVAISCLIHFKVTKSKEKWLENI
jgi:CD36 family